MKLLVASRLPMWGLWAAGCALVLVNWLALFWQAGAALAGPEILARHLLLAAPIRLVLPMVPPFLPPSHLATALHLSPAHLDFLLSPRAFAAASPASLTSVVLPENVATEQALAEASHEENASPATPAGVPISTSKLEEGEAVWMVEWQVIAQRAQVAQEWRHLRSRYPILLQERFVVLRPLPKSAKVEVPGFALYLGNFASIEQALDVCEQIREVYPRCQVWPAQAIGGRATPLKMSRQLSDPDKLE